MANTPKNTDKNIGHPNRHRILDGEETALWQQVQRTVQPIEEKRQELKHWLDEMDEETFAPIPSKPKPQPKSKPIATAAVPLRKYETTPYSPPVSKPAIKGAIDDRTAKKLLKGKLSIEDRIDLHGLTQSQAHSILLRFIVRSHDAGLRIVMVITGKGRLSEGILRNAVPNWLREPMFSNYVSAFRNAHVTHGGEGALYVRLRRKDGKAR